MVPYIDTIGPEPETQTQKKLHPNPTLLFGFELPLPLDFIVSHPPSGSRLAPGGPGACVVLQCSEIGGVILSTEDSCLLLLSGLAHACA